MDFGTSGQLQSFDHALWYTFEEQGQERDDVEWSMFGITVSAHL